MIRTVAHLSDLHVGRSPRSDGATMAACRALARAGVDEVLVSGDVTHNGLDAELDLWRELSAPLSDRLIVVPGNHDRLGDDAGRALMPGKRVDVEIRRGLFVVRVDSTAAHNARLLSSHGELTTGDLDEIDRAVASAPRQALVVVLLHHHVLPLPGDHLGERISSWLGLPHAEELARGGELAARLVGRCDLVLHGHRHRPAESVVGGTSPRPLRIVNAGSSSALGRARIFAHEHGRIIGERWAAVDGGWRARPFTEPSPARPARATPGALQRRRVNPEKRQ